MAAMVMFVVWLFSVSRSITVSGGTRRVPCSVECKWPGGDFGVVRHLHVDDIGVDVTMSMEPETYYPELVLGNRGPMRWISSTRMDSDVPVPYFSWAEYDIQAEALDYGRVEKGALFVASNCGARSRRLDIVKKLMLKVPVVSPGRCLRNARFGDGEGKHEMMRRHMFYLAFENSVVRDYVTEKLWGAYAAGAIPVYYGAPNIKSLAPNNSFISVTDFVSVSELGDHLAAVMKSRFLYESYHAWRRVPLPVWFLRLYNFTRTHSECRLCEKAERDKWFYLK